MSNPSEIISIDELQILFNLFDTITISYPEIPRFRLLKARPAIDKFKLGVDNPDFRLLDFEVGKDKGAFHTYHEFLECFLASGCITYENHDEFKQKYQVYKGMNKKVFYAPDTNILYHRYITSASPIQEGEVVMLPTVRDEIERRMNYKYTPTEINEIQSKLQCHQDLFNNLSRGRVKRSRKATCYANRELNHLSSIDAEEVSFTFDDYEQKDLKIIKELKHFETSRGAIAVFLTADRSSTDYSTLEKIEKFLFTMPRKVDCKECTYQQFQELVYNLSAMFGFIKLNSTYIFEEFGGKRNVDDVKVEFIDRKLHEPFKKDLETCRQLLNVNIEF